MRKHNFRNLNIWKDGIEIANMAYDFVAKLPSFEKFNLTSQITRCGVSIPSNIAEGSGRSSNKDFIRFLEYSLTSCYEMETQLIICKKRNYGNSETGDALILRLQSEQKQIFRFIESLKRSNV